MASHLALALSSVAWEGAATAILSARVPFTSRGFPHGPPDAPAVTTPPISSPSTTRRTTAARHGQRKGRVWAVRQGWVLPRLGVPT